jgi:hypothetical protein
MIGRHGNGTMRRFSIAVLLCSLFTFVPATGAQAPLNWKRLRNPVLSYSNWSIKDAAMAYRSGTFYVFFSAFYQDNGTIHSHVVEVSTEDFVTYSPPILSFDGREQGWRGMCSPDVQNLGDRWELSFNSWGDDPQRPDQLFYMTSPDLVHWSARQALGANLTAGESVIDLTVTRLGRGYLAVWRQGLEDFPKQIRVRVAAAGKLDGPWHFVGSGNATLRMANGRDNGLIHENYEFVRIGSALGLLSDDYRDDVEGEYLYRLVNSAQPLVWGMGQELAIPLEGFNRMVHCVAATLYDWRHQLGYYYLLYAGSNEQTSYLGRGWNRLALARSKDLVHWYPAGADN